MTRIIVLACSLAASLASPVSAAVPAYIGSITLSSDGATILGGGDIGLDAAHWSESAAQQEVDGWLSDSKAGSR